MPHVSIVIVHHNTPKDTIECLRSLKGLAHHGFEYQIIVVDNGSKNIFVLPAEFKKDNVEVVRSQANLGFTGGNNLGLHYSRQSYNSDYYLLLNSDTLVKKDFLEQLLTQANLNTTAGLLVPKIYFSKGREYHQHSYQPAERGKVLWFAGGTIDWPNVLAFHRGVDEVDRGQFDQQTQTDFATGCCVLIPQQVLSTVGLLDKRYFLYMEDVDYSMRVVKAGFSIRFCPQSIIWHKNAGSSGGAGADTSVYYQTRNRLLFGLTFGYPRVQLTMIGLWIRLFLFGSRLEKKAARDLLLGQLGKQPLV